MKKFFEKDVLKNGDFYVKLCFTILFCVVFLLSFFLLNGSQYFYSVVYADEFKGFDFQIHTLDVGQGDCFLIKLPNDTCMLIDSGESRHSNEICEYIDQFLKAENLKKIDYFVLTHPDSDHIGGAEKVLKEFKVENLLRPPVYAFAESLLPGANQGFSVDESLLYDNVVNYAYQKSIDMTFVKQGDKYDFDGCVVEFLSPEWTAYSYSNDCSAVIMFTWQKKKFLFMGDAENGIEEKLILKYGEYLKADVLKVGHHGSATSSSQKFLGYVKPSFAIISSGGNSKYFPHSTVINRLENLGTKIISTSKLGSFVLSVDNNEIVFAKAQRDLNYVALIFAVVVIFILIIWENPLKNNNGVYFTKKAS